MTREDAIAVAQGVARTKGWPLAEAFDALQQGGEWLIDAYVMDEERLDVSRISIAIDDASGEIVRSTVFPPKDHRPPPRVEGAPRLPVTQDEALRIAIESAQEHGHVLFRPQAIRRRELWIAGRAYWDVRAGWGGNTTVRVDEQTGQIEQFWVVPR